MLTLEQYKLYYDTIINNISKIKQTYKYFNDLLEIETISYLIDILSTWEFDDEWIKNNMSEKIKNENDKDKIREEFYTTLKSKISFEQEKLVEQGICGFYSTNTTITHKISSDKTIQKIEGRKIVVDSDDSNKKIILTFFLIYHMLIVQKLIKDEGLCITIDELKSDFTDITDIVNLCKICAMDSLIKTSDLSCDLEEFSKSQNIPMWFIENCIKYKNRQN